MKPAPAAPRPEAPATPPAPAPVDLGEESVAGEEDPGASLDLTHCPPGAKPPPAPAAPA